MFLWCSRSSEIFSKDICDPSFVQASNRLNELIPIIFLLYLHTWTTHINLFTRLFSRNSVFSISSFKSLPVKSIQLFHFFSPVLSLPPSYVPFQSFLHTYRTTLLSICPYRFNLFHILFETRETFVVCLIVTLLDVSIFVISSVHSSIFTSAAFKAITSC